MSCPVNGLAISLCDLPAGTIGRVDAVSLDAEFASRMAGLGISVGRQVRVVRRGEPLVVQVYGTQIGLARSLAEHVFITTERSAAAGR